MVTKLKKFYYLNTALTIKQLVPPFMVRLLKYTALSSDKNVQKMTDQENTHSSCDVRDYILQSFTSELHHTKRLKLNL